MDLFLAAGIEPDGARRGGRPARLTPGSRRVPLFNPKIVEDAAKLAAFNPTPEAQAAAARYAEMARNPKFANQKETSVRNLFFEEVLGKLLGYRTFDPAAGHSLAFEYPIRGGSVDVALGRFGEGGEDSLVAPFEMKGPGTVDLEAIPAGRGRSPVQQAWDYAVDASGARWVLVSNCVEIRLYGFGRGRDAYELFDLRKLDQPNEHGLLWLILSADRFLGGATEALLHETDNVYRTISSELYREYSALRERLIQFLVDSADGPKLVPMAAIEIAQTLLDRILFIAFAQRTDLLPDGLLKRALDARTPFDPKPAWYFLANLFRFLDQGHFDLDITAYNGGLFAPDPVTDAIIVPDVLAADLVALGEWDYRRDVPVTVLGHLFEQSVTDLEKMRAESRGEPLPKVSKRKRQGIVYTPEIVTHFLIERTLGATLAEAFATLLGRHADSKALPKKDAPIPWHDGETSERAFWREYLAVLRGLAVVDPACGSGHFLVAAFDVLAADYARVTDRLAALGEKLDFDFFDEIVTRNLYGVDLSAESVEITRLALWLKTARRKHRLQNLEATIKVGNSLIGDGAYTEHPFDWRAAFPEVFARGGFDIVVGNPPYVRMELIKPIKPYLAEHYTVATDRADLYAYFFERGVRLLKEGGRLGYISSSTFFRTGSGEKLRGFLGDSAAVEAVIDFGDLQLFEGVTTYPAIVTLKKESAGEGRLRFLKVERELPKDLDAAFEADARPMARARLTSGSWRFEDEPLARLRDKIVAGKKTLGEVYGPPLYGIKTGLNEAFIIDTATRDRLVAADPKSAELLRPYLRGEDIKRWRVEPEGLFLINTPRGEVDIEAYPAVRDWLLPFKQELERRATEQDWFELQQAQRAYQGDFAGAKIVYVDIADTPPFALDKSGALIDCTLFMVRGSQNSLLAFLNSKVAWFQWLGQTPIASGGYIRLKRQYINPTVLPPAGPVTDLRLDELASVATASAERRFSLQAAVRRRLRDLVPLGRTISKSIEHWWELDFAEFRAAFSRAYRIDIPVKERDEWQTYLAENAAEVRGLSTKIADAEREIDAITYRLFDLSPDEIALLEESIEAPD